MPLGRPRAVPNYLFSSPKSSKSAPRGSQEAKGGLNRFLDPPSGLQDRFGTNFGVIWGANLTEFWNEFEAIWEPCLEQKAEQRAERRAEQRAQQKAEQTAEQTAKQKPAA